MPHYRILINPRARRGADPQLRQAIAHAFSGVPHELLIPDSREAFIQAAHNARTDGVDVLVVVGGDGSINTVLPALSHSPVALAVIPAGTANDCARQLGMPMDVNGACQAILSGTPALIDLVQVGDALFVTGGGVGIVSRIALGVHALKTRKDLTGHIFHQLAGLAYTCHSALTLLFGTRLGCQLGLISDDQHHETIATLALFVNKQPTIGSNLTVCPDARPDDGHLSICWIAMRHRLMNVWVNWLLFRGGQHGRLPHVRMLTCKTLTLHSPDWLIFAGDGERLAEGHSLRLTVVPCALRVIKPTTPGESGTQILAPATGIESA